MDSEKVQRLLRKATLLTLFSLTISSAWAETSASVDQFLGSFLAMSEVKCSNMNGELAKQYEAAGNGNEAYLARTAEQAFCECMPARARKLRSSLTKQELATVMSESSFVEKRYRPQILDACAAERVRASYAEGCADRFSQVRSNSAKYCACMSRALSQFSDAEIAQIGIESSDDRPVAAEAKERGLSPAEEPTAFERFTSMELLCAGE